MKTIKLKVKIQTLIKLITINLIISSFSVSSQPDWQWVKNASGIGSEKANDITIDNEDNIYVIGNFNFSISFGTITITSNGMDDILIAKYDSSGNILWAKNLAGI